jgi:hypothetical protein
MVYKRLVASMRSRYVSSPPNDAVVGCSCVACCGTSASRNSFFYNLNQPPVFLQLHSASLTTPDQDTEVTEQSFSGSTCERLIDRCQQSQSLVP